MSVCSRGKYNYVPFFFVFLCGQHVRGLLEKYPTFGREKETGLLGALDT